MHEYVFEKVFISFYFWLILFLVAGTALSVGILIRRRMSGNTERRAAQPARPPRFKRKPRKPKDAFSEKLGEKVVNYMIDVARSKDRSVLRDRLQKIRRECERLSRDPLPPETKRIIGNVLFWSTHFDVDKHVDEMEIYHNSTQINYNHKTRDFKLMITQEK